MQPKWSKYFIKKYLGRYQGERLFINGFEWECGWYWAGGYITSVNSHQHFEGLFLDDLHEVEKDGRKEKKTGLWLDLGEICEDAQYTAEEWWRIKDLFKQFYVLRRAAEVFQYGGHCTERNRSEKEKSPANAQRMNIHIETVIIPEIIRALNHYEQPTPVEDAEKADEGTVRGFLKALGATMTTAEIENNPIAADWKEARHYRCEIRREGRKLPLFTYYSMGLAHEKPPTLEDVVSCLLDDAATSENRSFKEWCRDLGYDEDSRKHEQTYKAIGKNTSKLTAFFGRHYEKLTRLERER